MTKQKRIYVPATTETINAIKRIAKTSNRSDAYISMKLLETGLEAASRLAQWEAKTK